MRFTVTQSNWQNYCFTILIFVIRKQKRYEQFLWTEYLKAIPEYRMSQKICIHKVNIPWYNVYTSLWDTLYVLFISSWTSFVIIFIPDINIVRSIKE
jgi:hypothetical protein